MFWPERLTELGRTLMHEHLLVGLAGGHYDALTMPVDRREVIDEASKRLKEVKSLGFTTLVDPTTPDLQRDAKIFPEISRRSGVHIICATGLYSRFALPYFNTRSIDDLAESFIKEATDGLDGTGIKPGIIKCATSHGQITEYEEKVLRAVARCHKVTGLPIMTHTEEGTMGLEQVDIFESEGADLTKVIIGHSNDNTDLRYHVSILEKGANLVFDRFGYEIHTLDRFQTACLIGLLSMGYARHLVQGQGFLTQGADWSGARRRVQEQSRPAEVPKLLEKWNYTHLARNIMPMLIQAGVSQQQIDVMTVENPARILGRN